jgi:hypothetical protein
MMGQTYSDPGPLTGLQTLHAAEAKIFYHGGRLVFR